jgi:hypothetical protein
MVMVISISTLVVNYDSAVNSHSSLVWLDLVLLHSKTVIE